MTENVLKRCFAGMAGLLSVFSVNLYAQSFNLHSYTVSDGLPSNQVFGVLQPGTGEMYVGTEYGLVHFDGEDFTQIPFEESQYSGSAVLGLRFDGNKKLWIKTYRDGLFYLQQDTLRAFRGNQRLKQLIQASTIEQFSIDKNGNAWFTVGHILDTVFQVSSDGRVKKSHPVDRSIMQAGIRQFVFKVDEGFSLVCRTTKQYQVKVPWQEITNKEGFALALSNEYTAVSQTRAGSFVRNGDSYYLSFGNLLIAKNTRTGSIRKTLVNGEIHCLTLDIYGNLLIGTKNGAFIYDCYSSELVRVFSGQQVHAICQDSERGYWFATHNGLIYMPSLYMHIVQHSRLQGALNTITGDDSILAVSAMDGQLHIFRFINDKLVYSESHSGSTDLVAIPKKMLIHRGNLMYGQYYYKLDEGQPVNMYPATNGELLDIEQGESPYLLLLGYKRGFSFYHSGQNVRDEEKKLRCKDLFCRAICQAGNTIYLGTDHGLYTYTEKSGVARHFPGQINGHISDIKSAANGKRLIVSTRSAGVFVIENGLVTQLGLSSGLSSPFCTQLFIENDSTFWVGTTKGLNRIHWNTAHTYIDRWFTDDGLVSDKINELTSVGKYLFVLTDQGISYFEPQNLNTGLIPVMLELNEIRIQGQKLHGGEIRLKPNQTDVQFDFKVLGFKRGRNVQLSYQLTGKDQILSQTGGKTIMYSDLPPGNYTLEVKALGLGNKQLGETLKYTMIIDPHFYETRIFWVICIITLLFILVGSFYVYFKRLEAIRRRKWEYGNAQLEALNLQINPHFLFNALNSIQYLSLTREHKVLNRFISGLSELLRSILRNSKSNLVPLAIEIENIKRYLELEVVRFEDEEFRYQLTIDEDLLHGDIKIPPMILQPIVENAIWHGLLPLKGEKRLTLSVEKIGSGFSVVIEDNGRGINESMQAKKAAPEELKTSLGLDNVTRRMQLYQSMGFGESKIKITDLSTLGNAQTGTRVILIFKLREAG